MKTFIQLIFISLLLQTNFAIGQITDESIFIFGHSLIDHRPPAIPTPSDETTVPHWVYLLAQEAGHTYAAGGKYGFLPWHDDLPPFSQWGYDIVPGVWESDYEPFSDANLKSIMVTAGNFIQYVPSNMPHPVDYSTTVINSTETIFDWCNQQEANLRFYIYENWPEMNLPNGFPPTEIEFAAYNNETATNFHDWWIDYQDFMLASRPQYGTRLIPTGSIISKIFTDVIPNQIPITEIYEDSDPHGRASLYFLAGLVTYMSTYETIAPSSFVVPNTVHSSIQNNYQTIVNFIWTELINFNDDSGNSRVFYNSVTTEQADILVEQNGINLFPNPTAGLFIITGNLINYNIDILDSTGTVIQNLNSTESTIEIDINSLPFGLHFIRILNMNNNQVTVEKIIKN